ncbi:MAG: MobF family relaxase [Alteraurantiacibacter sp. bin_em_oilr2.035]|nr:MobF family relaxase [Alteraurantiacibacter sp. bin_em_oilr2.035]
MRRSGNGPVTASIAPVGSAGGAAHYFAQDDYYLGEGPAELSEWAGGGAEALGLEGRVDKEAFQNLLDGKLPDGTIVNSSEKRRAGIDLTFSLPKSASILALVSGDKRILQAHQNAVRQTMAQVESKYAEARDYSRNSNGEGVQTGNLAYAMFQHDTSRKLDPQSHIHVVIAAVTQTAGGKWKALWNGELWKNNTVIGSSYHAFARAEIEKLGYKTEVTGKHGQFEIRGVDKDVINEFSQRRADILQKSAELGISTPKGQDAVVINTRDAKLNVEDKDQLRAQWQERAAARGFDGQALIDASLARSGAERDGPIGVIGRANAIASEIRATVGAYLQPSDPLTTNGINRITLTPAEMRTEAALASAIRSIGEREAAFSPGQIAKTALDYGLSGVTPDKIDARMSELIKSGQLIPGASDRLDGKVELLTTPEHLKTERAVLSQIDAGRGSVHPIVAPETAAQRLNAVSGDIALNGEQLAAGTLALSSQDRSVVIQGVAGAGKTTLISAIASVAHEEGKQVVGIAVANKMVNDLRDGTSIRSASGELIQGGIEAQSLSSFVNQHIRGALSGKGEAFEQSRDALAGKIVVLDEASMVSNKQMLAVTTIANKLGVEKLVMIGDRQQLLAVEAGKAFALVQSHNPDMARMDTSQRQTTEHMIVAGDLARSGHVTDAIRSLGDRVVNGGANHLQVAAEKWLVLSPEDRDRTAIYSSGRVARSEMNAIVQAGLKAEGVVRGEGLQLTTLLPAHATREDLRHSATYQPGHILEVSRNNAPSGLRPGTYTVTGTDEKGRVQLQDHKDRSRIFDPAKIRPGETKDNLRLYEKHEEKIYEGDKIRWSDKDAERGLNKSEEARVLEIREGIVKFENAKGDIVEMKKNDRMLERLGLSYAINMHQAQGDNRDQAIGEIDSRSRHLTNERLALVMLTRVREDITIVSNDPDAMLKAIDRNPGDKRSALEATGEKSVDKAARTDAKETFSRPIPRGNLENMRPVPILDLPERNIERSR